MKNYNVQYKVADVYRMRCKQYSIYISYIAYAHVRFRQRSESFTTEESNWRIKEFSRKNVYRRVSSQLTGLSELILRGDAIILVNYSRSSFLLIIII